VHELSIAENLLEVALRNARDAGGGRITDLHLVIGRLSSVVDESVEFCWQIVARGTPAEGSSLHFRRLGVAMRCLDCDAAYAPEGDDLSCPDCGGAHVRFVAGTEFRLEAIDVDDEAPGAPAAVPSPGDER
jgi:hydrogenase nickel incorporation protein HypA/HybF